MTAILLTVLTARMLELSATLVSYLVNASLKQDNPDSHNDLY